MKKLFLFAAGGDGAYLGGMAGATADNAEQAFWKLKEAYNKDCGYLDTYYPDNKARGNNWGFIPFKQVWTEDEMIFCECHDG